MTIAEMLGQSGKLSLIGMGIVFLFLVVLVVTITLVGKVIHAFGLDKETGAQAKTAGRGPVAASQTAIVAAIGAAVNQYQKDNS
jgi:oxaloacetate decarboxylase gamma subunit